jgi:hypothetical protein
MSEPIFPVMFAGARQPLALLIVLPGRGRMLAGMSAGRLQMRGHREHAGQDRARRAVRRAGLMTAGRQPLRGGRPGTHGPDAGEGAVARS